LCRWLWKHQFAHPAEGIRKLYNKVVFLWVAATHLFVDFSHIRTLCPVWEKCLEGQWLQARPHHLALDAMEGLLFVLAVLGTPIVDGCLEGSASL